jgi:hypothetical protein
MLLSREAWNARRRDFAGVLDLQIRFESVEPVVQPIRPGGPNGGRP